MFCRNCGTELDPGARFCRNCGTEVPRPVTAAVRKPPYTVLLIVAVVAIALVLALQAVIPSEEPSLTVGDTTVTGGLVTDDIVVSDGRLDYTGSDTDVGWLYSDVHGTYLVRDGTGYTDDTDIRVAGAALVLEPGMYDVSLLEDGSRTHRGTVLVDGDVTRTFSWSCIVQGEPRAYTMTYTYGYSDFLAYAEAGSPRHHVESMEVSRFVPEDATVLGMAEALEETYTASAPAGTATTGQDYADYLLAFVQVCFAYPDTVSAEGSSYVADPDGSGDLFLYGEVEYWAYPMETIHHGMGDCEDTTFLYAALCSASGYTSAIALLEGHMVPGVVLDGFEQRSFVPPSLEPTGMRFSDGGGIIYFCETTLSTPVPAGYLPHDTHAEVLGLESVSKVDPYGVRW